MRFLLLTFLSVISLKAFTCTGFLLRTVTEDTVYGRTMEWGAFDLQSDLIVIPRNQPFESHPEKGRTGIKWKNIFGFVGINAAKKPFITDGMNETGLTVGVLYFPGFAKYQEPDESKLARTITNVDLAAWMLGNFDDTRKIEQALPGLRVVHNEALDRDFGAPTPLHHMVTDNKGRSIIIEYVKGKLTIYENKLGVMTNAPGYDWHLDNLRNYAAITPMGVPLGSLDHLNGVDVTPVGAGSGFIGLPGDFLPTSRFIRATAFVYSSIKLKSAEEARNQASRILNNFDIPKGAVREGRTKNDFHLNITQWSVIGDIKNRCYYYWTEHNRRMRLVDLKTIDFRGGSIISQPLDKKQEQDIERVVIKKNPKKPTGKKSLW